MRKKWIPRCFVLLITYILAVSSFLLGCARKITLSYTQETVGDPKSPLPRPSNLRSMG